MALDLIVQHVHSQLEKVKSPVGTQRAASYRFETVLLPLLVEQMMLSFTTICLFSLMLHHNK